MAKAIGTREERFVKWLEQSLAENEAEWVNCKDFADYVGWSSSSFETTLERLIAKGTVRRQAYGGGRIQLTVKQAIQKPSGVRVFISYSHDDDEYRKALHKHLSPLERMGKITVWTDREIPAGEDWGKQIHDRLDDCDIFIVLVSSSFIASHYCYDVELTDAINRHRAGSMKIIPVVVRNCIWNVTPLGAIQHATLDNVAIASAPNQDDALTAAATSIAKVVDAVLSKRNG